MEASWGPLGGLWRSLGRLFGPSWGPWRPSWDHLEGYRSKKGGPQLSSPLWSPQGRLMDPSWGPLRALLGAPGTVLGPSWAPLGALLGHLGAILRPQEPIGREKARGQKTLKNIMFLTDFGLLGASLGGSEGTWSRPGAVLRALGGLLKAMGYLARSWRPSSHLRSPLGAILGHLGRSDRSRIPPSRPRGRG